VRSRLVSINRSTAAPYISLSLSLSLSLAFLTRRHNAVRFTHLSISQRTGVRNVFSLLSIYAFATKRNGTVNVGAVGIGNERTAY